MHVTWVAIKQAIPRAKNLLSGKESIVHANGEDTMSRTVKSDLYHALSPIYYLSKIFGLLPVRFVLQTSGKYLGHIRILDICYGALTLSLDSAGLLFFLIGAIIYGLWRDLRDGWANSTRLKSHTAMIVTIGDVLAVAFLAGVATLGAASRWKYLQDIVARLVEADERLGYLAPKKTRGFSIIMSGSTLTFLASISSLDIYAWHVQTRMNNKMADKGPINYSPIYGLYMVALMIEIQYTISTYNLGERFARLNKNLDGLLKGSKCYDFTRNDYNAAGNPREQGNVAAHVRPEMEYRTSIRVYRTPKISDWLVNEGETRNISESISQLLTVHSSLCDVALLINAAFGVPILVLTITCLLHLIITPYVMIAEASTDREGLFIAVQLLWCSFHVLRMLIVIQPSYSTSTEAKSTAIKIGQLLSANWEPEVRKQLEIFSLQLLHRPLDFSACGMFSLDRALVTSMAGAVTTYLVILIQFQKADDTVDASNLLKNATQQLLKNATSLSSQRHSSSFQ